jgi:hypothetical protein
MHTDNAQKRGKPFPLGNRSGKGRPVGSRNKATLLLKEMMEGEAPAVGRKLIELVQKGVMPAIKIYMDRVYPLQRERPVALDLPKIVTADDLRAAHATVVKEMALGNITPTEAERVTNVLEFRRKSIETEDLARGLAEVRAELRELKEIHERRAA